MKLQNLCNLDMDIEVAPRAGAWIETWRTKLLF